MTNIRVTKEFEFEMAHALWNYDGPCKNIHGHSYRLFVTVMGIPIDDGEHAKFGMVIDFKDLKAIVHKEIIDVFDHSLLLYIKTANKVQDTIREMYEKVLVYNFQPTCENLIIHFSEILIKHLPDNIHLHALKLFETSTSYAEWFASDNT